MPLRFDLLFSSPSNNKTIQAKSSMKVVRTYKIILPKIALFIKTKIATICIKISLYMAPTCFGPFGPSSGSMRRTAPNAHNTNRNFHCHCTITILTMYFN
jgi:hypothetical protein